MSAALPTYLHDHLAGSKFAIELLESLRDQNGMDEIGRLAATLLPDVRQDREVLQGIADRVGTGHMDLKEAASWIAQQASQFKLHRDAPGGIGIFEALETLALGVLGKRGLWRALAEIAKVDPRVDGVDFRALEVRAEQQYQELERQRLATAQAAFKVAS